MLLFGNLERRSGFIVEVIWFSIFKGYILRVHILGAKICGIWLFESRTLESISCTFSLNQYKSIESIYFHRPDLTTALFSFVAQPDGS